MEPTCSGMSHWFLISMEFWELELNLLHWAPSEPAPTISDKFLLCSRADCAAVRPLQLEDVVTMEGFTWSAIVFGWMV